MRSVVVCLVSVAAVASGCGGSSNADRNRSTTNDEGSKPPARVIHDAVSVAGRASSVHIVGQNIPTITGNGPILSFNMWLARGKGARGSVTKKGFRFDVVRVGDAAYIRGSDAFYRHINGPAMARLLHGRWLTSSKPGSLGSVAYLTELHAFLASFQLTPAHTAELAQGATPNVTLESFAGQKAFAIRENTRRGVTRWYVASTGAPYLLAIVARPRGGGPAQALKFSDWNAPISLQPPKHAIDISKLRRHH